MKIEINDDDSVTIDGRLYVINEDGNVVIDGRVYVPRDDEPDAPRPWPQDGDSVVVIYPDGLPVLWRYGPDVCEFLDAVIAQGNGFSNLAEAEAERDRRAAEQRVMQAWRRMIAPHEMESKGFVYHSLFEAMYARTVPNDGGVPDTIVREMPDDVRRMLG